MNAKPRIKIIKRNEQQSKPVAQLVTKKTPTAKSAAREMVATVTEWVNEFQQKRRDETQETLHKFFSQTPNPSKC